MLAFCGCSSSEFVPVSGQVTVDGTPVSTGRVEFFPATGRPAVGRIDEEGRYELRTKEPGDGARPGKYLVTITSRSVMGESQPPLDGFDDPNSSGAKGQSRRQPVSVKWNVPRSYSKRTTSGLTAEVTEDGEAIDFNLSSKHPAQKR